MSGCDGYVCMGCGKCYGISAKGKPGQDVCLVCGMPLAPGEGRCSRCGSPAVRPLDARLARKASGGHRFK